MYNESLVDMSLLLSAKMFHIYVYKKLWKKCISNYTCCRHYNLNYYTY